MQEKKLSIIVPAFNEVESLKDLLPELIEYCSNKPFQLIVVNDGSTDKTADFLHTYQDTQNISVISNKVNRGYGGAIKRGFSLSETEYCSTMDADGQHSIQDIENLYHKIIETDADLVVGDRGSKGSSYYKGIGKWLIRKIAGVLIPLPIKDLNSGIKIYRTSLVKKYLALCPDGMAFSDIITLIFVHEKHLVMEIPVSITERKKGKSKISTMTAFETVSEILNIVVLCNPMRIFLPISILAIVLSLMWGIPIVLKGRGVSVGAMLGFSTGVIFFFLGLLAEQLSEIRKNMAEKKQM